jgi:hypothetical protein
VDLIAGTKRVRIRSVYLCGILAFVVEREGEKDRLAGCEGGFLERKSAGDLCGAEGWSQNRDEEPEARHSDLDTAKRRVT